MDQCCTPGRDGVRAGISRSRNGRGRLRDMVEELESRVLLSHVASTHLALLPRHQHAAMQADSGLTPAMVRQAYGINQVMFGSAAGDGAGQTIAIVTAYNAPRLAEDLHAFDALYGLPDPTLTLLNQNGGTTLPGNDPAGPGNSWALETSLDVEWAHVVVPRASIVVVMANSASSSDLYAAVNTARRYAGVSVVSMSWSGDEISSDIVRNGMFTTPAGHTGVTFVAATGDVGAYGANGTSLRVGYPAASPNVLAVGGTALRTDGAGNYLSEAAWGSGDSSGIDGGSGGGISRYQKQPAYQAGVVTQTATMRALPDVSLIADPAMGVAVVASWDYGDFAPHMIGGTSLATPMWAGVIALANQGRMLAGLGTLDGATETLPQIYALPAGDFHDITTGSNGYEATVGFDLATGRGTPIVNKVVADLAMQSLQVPARALPVVRDLAVTPGTVISGTRVVLTASDVEENGGGISGVTFYRESNGQAGLQTGADIMVGTGVQNGTAWTMTAPTQGLAPGSYTYYAVAADDSGATAQASAVLTVEAPPTPANDAFAAGIVLSGTTADVTGTNVNASKEAGEPAHAGKGGGHSIWWTWTAPATGAVTLDTSGSSFDTLLAVYTGGSVNKLVTVASNQDANIRTTTSLLTFKATEGITYHIAVDGYNGATGDVALHLNLKAAPANDALASAVVFTGGTWTGSNDGATRESGEPSLAKNAGGASVWLVWKATSTRTVKLSTAGSGFDTLLGVYTGATVKSLKQVAGNDDVSGATRTSAVSFKATAGKTYRIRVDGYAGATGSIVLTMS